MRFRAGPSVLIASVRNFNLASGFLLTSAVHAVTSALVPLTDSLHQLQVLSITCICICIQDVQCVIDDLTKQIQDEYWRYLFPSLIYRAVRHSTVPIYAQGRTGLFILLLC